MNCQYDNYAIYWVPRGGSPLETFGTAWSGWCADSGTHAFVPEEFQRCRRHDGVPGQVGKLGIHANVKSPFRLAQGRSIWALDRALQDLADRTAAIRLPRFELEVFDNQVVLALSRPNAAVIRLLSDVADLVRLYQVEPEYHTMPGFADAPVPASRDWGATNMPVLERFHLPLSDRLDLGTAFEVVDMLRPKLGEVLTRPQLLADLALVGDPGGNRPWRLIDRYELNESPVRARPKLPVEMECQGPQLMTTFEARTSESGALLTV